MHVLGGAVVTPPPSSRVVQLGAGGGVPRGQGGAQLREGDARASSTPPATSAAIGATYIDVAAVDAITALLMVANAVDATADVNTAIAELTTMDATTALGATVL